MKFYHHVVRWDEMEAEDCEAEDGEWVTREEAEQVEQERDAYKKVARDMEECVDNVREAMGLESTHYLVLHDDVRDMRLQGEQAARDAVEMAKAVRHYCVIYPSLVADANAIIERYEGGKG